jgi:hypothetical protein
MGAEISGAHQTIHYGDTFTRDYASYNDEKKAIFTRHLPGQLAALDPAKQPKQRLECITISHDYRDRKDAITLPCTRITLSESSRMKSRYGLAGSADAQWPLVTHGIDGTREVGFCDLRLGSGNARMLRGGIDLMRDTVEYRRRGS